MYVIPRALTGKFIELFLHLLSVLLSMFFSWELEARLREKVSYQKRKLSWHA